MRIATLAACLALAGCAASQNITPEQRAAILRYTAQQQQLQQQQADGVTRAYQTPQPPAASSSTTCTTTPIGAGQLQTVCR